MKKILNLLTIFAVGITSTSTTANVIACGKENNMVKLFGLQEDRKGFWHPLFGSERSLIIEVDKTTIDKYTLKAHADGHIADRKASIVFYFKDKSINNIENRTWSGPTIEYTHYFTKELGIKPTPYEQWMPVFGYKWIEGAPTGSWEKDYNSTESFGINPQIVRKVFLKKIEDKVSIKIEYLDWTVEERFQATGNPKDYRSQFEGELKIDPRNIIIEE